jgi:hypothetical protein
MQDLSPFVGILPYSSELFGVYQPLVGWKSQRTAERFDAARVATQRQINTRLLNSVQAFVDVSRDGERQLPATRWAAAPFQIENLRPVRLDDKPRPALAGSITSGVAILLQEHIGDVPPADWSALISADSMTDMLHRLQKTLNDPNELDRRPDLRAYVETFVGLMDPQAIRADLLQAFFDKESRIAGYLVFLAQHTPAVLTGLFFKLPRIDAIKYAMMADPLLNFGDGQYSAVLSPVGIVHLYRQYFFEFDSFLGPPVGHVWLSPGGTIELIEVNTRKTLTERTVETSLETSQKSELATTTQDDISDAVKDENKDNVKFGFTNVAEYSTPVFHDTATASLSLDNTKTTSRETTHKQMRQQSEKLTSEIKRNFKTTFKTSTETTDTTSKRYVIQNTTNRLVNYELRRKMRKVGVQVQDIGVQLCWQTFVDDSGRALGVSKLVHIGEKPDLADLVHPDAPQGLTTKTETANVAVQFVGLDTDDTDNAYTQGSETEVGFLDSTEHIQWRFPQSVNCSAPGYQLTNVTLNAGPFDAQLSVADIASDPGSSKGTFTLQIDYVNWGGQSSFNATAALTWEPDPQAAAKIEADYRAKVSEYTAERARRYKEAFLQASRERIKLASTIVARPAADLREEERTVVYRNLISQLMKVGGSQSHHVTSELIRSIFDVDKMLYFVAPEWWVPRLHRSTQNLGDEIAPPAPPPKPSTASAASSASIFKTSAVKFGSVNASHMFVEAAALADSPPTPAAIPAANFVDWGGAGEFGRDNYFITEESAPAKLGSSLGWLLQLDGDNLRNAFLNAPWVKAVIPIRIGKEKDAINWLSKAHVEGSDGLDAVYVAAPGDPPELQGGGLTVRAALDKLAEGIVTFDQNARTAVIPNPADPDDPSNHYAGSLATEAVYENGFYPLKGGIKFNQSGVKQVVFSQWMEILPTDQVAALEVEYDSKTLQVKVLPQPPGPGAVPPGPPPPP